MDSPFNADDVDDVAADGGDDEQSVAAIRRQLSFSPDTATTKGKLNATVTDALNGTLQAIPEVPVDGREPIRVFLRLKPLSLDVGGRAERGCVEYETAENRVTLLPPDGARNGKDAQHYFFSRVFAPETTQADFFENTALPLVADLARGRNGLMFAYGITNSGKTFTIQGTKGDAGVLPRALDVLFNSIRGKVAGPDARHRPLHFSSFDTFADGAARERVDHALRDEVLNGRDPIQALKEAVLQQRRDAGVPPTPMRGAAKPTLPLQPQGQTAAQPANKEAPGIVNLSMLNMTVIAELGADDEYSVPPTVCDSRTVPVAEDCAYAVYVSYTEIYNEFVYDLLSPAVATLPVKRRQVLKMMQDREHHFCVEGAREILVRSPEEAYAVLRYGQRNRRVAATILNQESSRSHGVLTIRLMAIPKSGAQPTVSVLTFVDLAGSERANRTHNRGAQLKEAGHINTSLMTLARCIETLRSNQLHPAKQEVVPFRDSKLTLLLHNFLRGTGKAVMVVNAGQSAADYVETAKVMRLSAVAKQVKTTAEIGARVQTRRRAAVAATAEAPAAGTAAAPSSGASELQLSALSAQCTKYEEYIDELEKENDALFDQLDMLKREHADEVARVESEVREEAAREMAEQLKQMEASFKNVIAESNDACEERTERRADIQTRALQSAKKRAGTRSRVAFAVPEGPENAHVSAIKAAATEAATSPFAHVIAVEKAAEASMEEALSRAEALGAAVDGFRSSEALLVAQLAEAKARVEQLERDLAAERANHDEMIRGMLQSRNLEMARLKSEAKMETVSTARRPHTPRAGLAGVFSTEASVQAVGESSEMAAQATVDTADSEMQTEGPVPMEIVAPALEAADVPMTEVSVNASLVTSARDALACLDEALDVAMDANVSSVTVSEGAGALSRRSTARGSRKTRSPKRKLGEIDAEHEKENGGAGRKSALAEPKRRRVSAEEDPGEGAQNTSAAERKNVSFADDSILTDRRNVSFSDANVSVGSVATMVDREPDRNQSYLEAVAPSMPLSEQVEAAAVAAESKAKGKRKSAAVRAKSASYTAAMKSEAVALVAASAVAEPVPTATVAVPSVPPLLTTEATQTIPAVAPVASNSGRASVGRRKSSRGVAAPKGKSDAPANSGEAMSGQVEAAPVLPTVSASSTIGSASGKSIAADGDAADHVPTRKPLSPQARAGVRGGRVRADGGVGKVGPRLEVLVKNSPIAKRLVQSGVATQSHMRTVTPDKRGLFGVLGEIAAKPDSVANIAASVEDPIIMTKAVKATSSPRSLVDALFEKPHPVVTRVLLYVGLATEVVQQDLLDFIAHTVAADPSRSLQGINPRKLIDLMMEEASKDAGAASAGARGKAHGPQPFGVLLEKTRKRTNNYRIHPSVQQYVTDRCNIANGDGIEAMRNEIADYILLRG